MQDLNLDLYGKITEPWLNFRGAGSEKRDHSHPSVRNTEQFYPKKRPFLVRDAIVSSDFDIKKGSISWPHKKATLLSRNQVMLVPSLITLV